MILKTQAQAGTLESSDVMVLIKPLKEGEGRVIAIDSNVKKQYGSAIEDIVNEVLNQFEVEDVKLHINDKGALASTLKARLETAVKRAMGVAEGTLND